MLENKEIIMYESKDGKLNIDVNLKNETVWLTQKQMGILFDRDYKTISKHIINIFNEGELERNSTVANFAIVQNEGGREVIRDIEHYNLDVIISVGYRVKSKRGTQFRIWATNLLKQHLINDYTINEKRLKEQNQKLEEKGANLLYFIVKNHSFSDGNKRIAAAIFIYFMSRNNMIYREDGTKRIADKLL